MKRHTLKVTKREVLGKNVKKLRREGILPANIYGPKTESTSVQLSYDDFIAVYKEAGETSLVDIELNGKKNPVLIHNVQMDYLTHLPLHADFFQVNLKEKVSTFVPVVMVGEAKAVTDNLGLMLQNMDEVLVEALPTDLPEKIEVDVTSLSEVGNQILVEQLKVPAGVEIVSEPSATVVRIGELIAPEPEPVEETPSEIEVAEGEAPTESLPSSEEKSEEPAE